MDTFLMRDYLRDKNHAAVQKYTRNDNIFTFDLIFIAVHIHGNHWVLVSIDFENQQILYLDSLGDTEGDSYEILSTILEYLNEESLAKNGKEFSTDGWFWGFVEGLAKQKNGVDCGVFVAMWANFKARGKPLDLVTQDRMPYFRDQMAQESYTNIMVN